MQFKGKRWLIKEYNTQTIWLLGIVIILLFYYPQLSGNDPARRMQVLLGACILLALYYLSIRYLKKSGKWA